MVSATDLIVSIYPLRTASILLQQQDVALVGTDKASWIYVSEEEFSVLSCRRVVNAEHIPYGPLERNDLAFKLVWKMDVPIKVMAFSYRCFIKIIPT